VLTLTLISVAVGIALAAVYQLLSGQLQIWASKQRATMMPAITVLGFLIRLTVLAVILVVFGLWTPLNMLAVCLAFIVVFSILTGIMLYRMAIRRSKSGSTTGTDEKG
jgi:hypothetical protein